MHKIGIISDTHGLLRPEVLKNLRDCDVILHCGDIGGPEILKKLEGTALVYAVRGNNDLWRTDRLPEHRYVALWGIEFFMVHDKKGIPGEIKGVDVVLCGHSHRYEESCFGGALFLNPGSCGPRRFSLPVTMAVMKVTEPGTFFLERIDLSGPEKRKRQPNKPGNMRELIRRVMRDTDRGIPVWQIAAKHKMSPELAEQICRLYLTHPGVDEDGIMTKMGL